jgi:HD-like signal output (HDOD) protein
VAEIESLPSVPTLYQEIATLSRDPRVTLEALGAVIERDVAMSATVLKLVNSAYFGMIRPVDSVTGAVMFLGLDTIRALVLGTCVFQEYRGLPPEILSVEELWDHSVRTSAFVRAIAKLENVAPEVLSHASLAAMFHDVGKLILVTHDATKYRKVLERVGREKRRSSDIELEVYHATHAEIGAYLLGLWGFPDDVVRAVAFHARPLGSWDDARGATTWVHVADALARAVGGPKDLATSHIDAEYLRAHGWADKLPQWTALCASLMPGAAPKR